MSPSPSSKYRCIELYSGFLDYTAIFFLYWFIYEYFIQLSTPFCEYLSIESMVSKIVMDSKTDVEK